MAYFCGIDIGASAAKLVIVDGDRQVVAKAVRRSGVDYAADRPSAAWPRPWPRPGCAESQIAALVSTGYGRDNVPWADGKMTEIACHGKGRLPPLPPRDDRDRHRRPGQQGDPPRRRTAAAPSFKMNRKCAAGTGAFLEEIAYRLDLPLSRAERPGRALDQGGRRWGASARSSPPRRSWRRSAPARRSRTSSRGRSARWSSGSWRWTPSTARW